MPKTITYMTGKLWLFVNYAYKLKKLVLKPRPKGCRQPAVVLRVVIHLYILTNKKRLGLCQVPERWQKPPVPFSSPFLCPEFFINWQIKKGATPTAGAALACPT